MEAVATVVWMEGRAVEAAVAMAAVEVLLVVVAAKVHMCMCMVEVETVEALSVSVGIVGQRHGGSGCSGDSGASRGL